MSASDQAAPAAKVNNSDRYRKLRELYAESVILRSRLREIQAERKAINAECDRSEAQA